MSEETSKCPVKHSNNSVSNEPSPFWSRLWGGSDKNDEGCRPEVSPASLEEAAAHAQTPQPNQKMHLGKDRQVSGITRGDSALPQHQAGGATSSSTNNWVYPSEQQLFNAMRRKGWSNVPEESIPVVLQIHNGINERTWAQIQDWEGTEDLQLAKFQGRPRDMTPKAFFLSKILRLYDPPFDRHDWYVSNQDRQQRYVIDYYYLPSKDPNMPPIPYVDARPALESPRAVLLQSQRFFKNAFPGIAAHWKRFQEQK
jgi:cytochrome c heme-lyase